MQILLIHLNLASTEPDHVPPKHFNVVSRIGQILPANLRMECSSLNSHLYRKNIVPSPSCTSGSFESPYHYVFLCPRYTSIRQL